MMKNLLLAVVVALCIVAGCANPRVTRANYDMIHEGMAPEEVEEILGKPTWHHKNKRYYRGEYGTIKIKIEKGLVEDVDWDDRD